MKKIIAFIIAAVITTGAYAQSNKEEVDMIQAMYGKAKKDLVKEYMMFNEAEATKFWTVYDAFETERKALQQERLKIISDYASHYDSLNNAKAAELGGKALANNVGLEKLNQAYFKKFSDAVGGIKAAKFMQLELYMQTAVRAEVQNAIPFIGELDKSRKNIE